MPFYHPETLPIFSFAGPDEKKYAETASGLQIIYYLCSRNDSHPIQLMTTVELRTSITAELDQMSVEMLESVSRYVSRLRRRARVARQTSPAPAGRKPVQPAATGEAEELTPRVMRFKRGNPWYATDEEVDRLLQEHLTRKFQ